MAGSNLPFRISFLTMNHINRFPQYETNINFLNQPPYPKEPTYITSHSTQSKNITEFRSPLNLEKYGINFKFKIIVNVKYMS